MKKPLALLFVAFYSLCLFSQNESNYTQIEKKLNEYGQKIVNSALYQDREEADRQFTKLLTQFVEDEASMNYPLKTVSSLINISSQDSLIRILSWTILDANNNYQFRGIVQRKNDKEDYFYYHLKDQSAIIQDAEKADLTAQKWFGCLYYEIALVNNGMRDVYTLLGWDGNNNLSHKKVIELMYFDGQDSIRFGTALIKDQNNDFLKRKIFEFSAELKMTLKFQKELNRIVFDHLSPSNPTLKGVYEYYGPDFSFDSYNWDGRYWTYKADIDVDAPLEKKEKYFEVPKKDTIQSKNLFNPLGKKK